ncbi:MAG: hypothetical protein ACI4F4_06555 [Lachnospiraceae bacterium]
MKHHAKKYRNMILAFIFVISLTGCSFGFHPSSYLNACLDACTKGEVTEYAKMTGTSEEEALKLYNNIIDANLQAFDNYQISEDKKAAFKTLFQTMYQSLSYEVGEASKNADGSYSVPVTIKKLIVFDTIVEDSETYIKEYARTHSSASTTELSNALIDFMYDSLSNNLQNPNYGDSQVITIRINKTGNNTYRVSDSDLQSLILSMLDTENIQ